MDERQDQERGTINRLSFIGETAHFLFRKHFMPESELFIVDWGNLTYMLFRTENCEKSTKETR